MTSATPRVTVCIPAFKSGAQVFETLKSVQDQSFDDFQVRVAIEPTGSDTFDPDIRRLFEKDARFSFWVNEKVLGWAGNIDRLISRVDTELFAVLPHDDLWDGDYLRALTAALAHDDDASIAYPDIQLFGHAHLQRVMRLDNSSVGARLYSFYMAGADAHPWRGLARSRARSSGVNFLHNRHMSFAVECVWTQHLLCRGAAIRVPRFLYRKRACPPDRVSVSGHWRHRFSIEEKRAALNVHRLQMLGGIPEHIPGEFDRRAVVLACEVAMLWRTRAINENRFGLSAGQMRRAKRIRRTAGTLEPQYAGALTAKLDDVLALFPPTGPEDGAIAQHLENPEMPG